MQIKQYYEKLINNENLEGLKQKMYFDYQGEGYETAEFAEVNPLVNIQNHQIILSYFNKEYGFVFYQYTKDKQEYKAMDLLLKKAGEFTDHYLCHNVILDQEEVKLEKIIDHQFNEEDTMKFMKEFWEGKDVKYHQNYREHSTFTSEITYENVIGIHGVGNYLIMLCDAKIDGIYGTLADLYVIEGNQFLEHWDVFTVDKVQPPEPEFTC